MTTTLTTTNDHAERSHSKFSPSSLKSRAICPSWENIRDAEPHPVTLQGTKCHEAAEVWDYTGLDEEETEMVSKCQQYHDLVTKGMMIDVEPRLRTHEPQTYGFADVVAVSDGGNGDKAHVLDWKFGWNYQGDAETNLQGIAYAIGTFLAYPNVENVTVHFCYPRTDQITTHTFNRAKDLAKMKLAVSTVVARSQAAEDNKREAHKDPAFFTPDTDNCTWCGYKAHCPALASYALSVAKQMDPDDVKLSLVDPNTITEPDTMAIALQFAPVLESWAKSVKAFALCMRIDDGIEIPGYDLNYRSSKLTTSKPVEALNAAKAHGVSDEEFAECTSVSVAKLAKKVSEHSPPRKKAAWDAMFREELLEAGTATQGEEITYLKADKSFDFSTLKLK